MVLAPEDWLSGAKANEADPERMGKDEFRPVQPGDQVYPGHPFCGIMMAGGGLSEHGGHRNYECCS
jgi:hypothetical protein